MMKEKPNDVVVHLSNQQIDRQKWDACVASSSLPLIYAIATFLDGMCKHWDALVLGDYEMVMPLPWNRKWRVSYMYSPYYVMAGGIFGKQLTAENVAMFLKSIPEKFWYIDFDLNEHNYFPSLFPELNISFRQRRNTMLTLDRSYKEIYNGYSQLAKRKIKKASQHQLLLNTTAPVKTIIELYRQYYKEQDCVVSRYDYTGMVSLLSGSLASRAKTYTLTFPDGDIAAFYLLLFDDHYVYWIMGGSTQRGKKAAAFYSITNLVIEEFAGSQKTFRFEGSDHEGIHFFNAQFGGETVYYPRLVINHLPWPFRYFK